MPLEYAVEDQVVQRKRRFERIADDVVEIEPFKTLRVGEAVGMEHHQHTELFCFLPERRESRIGQFLAGDVGDHLHAGEAELLDATLEFFCRFVAIRHRHRAKSLEAVGLLRAERGDAVVHDLRGLHRDLDRHGVVALRWRRRDHLDVNAHGVEISKTLVGAGVGADVGFLLLVERLGLRIGEVRQGYRRQIEVRLDEFRRLGHRDMGMNVDGRAFRPHLAARFAMLAGGRRAVLVPLLGHHRSFSGIGKF